MTTTLRTVLATTIVAALAATVSVASAATAGQSAPDFTATDAAGKTVRLSDYKGRFVVLEWVNPDCPFVQKHYVSKNMQDLQRAWGAKGVVWLAVNSTREGHSEYRDGAAMNAWMSSQGASAHSVVIDGRSDVGRAYAAKTTPHMFVIDPAGRIVYAGAIDDKRSANPADAKTAKNYVTAALTEATAGKTVTTAGTTPYGCSVKY